MPLTNFGAILNFAEALERRDREDFRSFSDNPDCSANKTLFEQFAKECEKNIKTIQRIRRENVTEMILEPIRDFSRRPYSAKCECCESMGINDALSSCKSISEKAEDFYTKAAEKLKAQPEVARALKRIGKKRKSQLNHLPHASMRV